MLLRDLINNPKLIDKLRLKECAKESKQDFSNLSLEEDNKILINCPRVRRG